WRESRCRDPEGWRSTGTRQRDSRCNRRLDQSNSIYAGAGLAGAAKEKCRGLVTGAYRYFLAPVLSISIAGVGDAREVDVALGCNENVGSVPFGAKLASGG